MPKSELIQKTLNIERLASEERIKKAKRIHEQKNKIIST